jgi:hypothetical protein
MGPVKDQIHAKISVSEGLTDKEMQRMNAHEGSHLEDGQNFASSFDPKTGKYSAQKNYTSRQTEKKAYELGNRIKPYTHSDQELQRDIIKNYPDTLVWQQDSTE